MALFTGCEAFPLKSHPPYDRPRLTLVSVAGLRIPDLEIGSAAGPLFDRNSKMELFGLSREDLGRSWYVLMLFCKGQWRDKEIYTGPMPMAHSSHAQES